MQTSFKTLLPLLLLTLPDAVQAQFTYTSNNGQVTITRYGGPGGAVVIPSSINVGGTNLPVASIGGYYGSLHIWSGAFEGCASLTSVTIPNSVTNIGWAAFAGCTSLASVTIPNDVTGIGPNAFYNCSTLTGVTIGTNVTSIGVGAFQDCTSLTAITVDASNSFYSSRNGVLFDKSQSTLVEYPGGLGGSYTIPNSVINIGYKAFMSCSSLTGVTIGTNVTSLGDYAFYDCTNLTGVWFQGNAPTTDSTVFSGDANATAYYLPGTTGWAAFSVNTGLLTVLWNPQVPTSGGSFGVLTNGFGFTISGASNLVIVVEACTNLANHSWSPVGTNTLTGGWSYFSDPQWTNYPVRFYRIRSP